MKRYVDKIGVKSLIAISYFSLLLVFAGLFSSTHEAIIGHMEDARSTGAWALSEIYKSTLEYRLAEMGSRFYLLMKKRCVITKAG